METQRLRGSGAWAELHEDFVPQHWPRAAPILPVFELDQILEYCDILSDVLLHILPEPTCSLSSRHGSDGSSSSAHNSNG